MIDLGRHARITRFLVSGGSGFALYYLAAMLLDRVSSLDEGLCAFLATLLSIPPTFLLQRSFTFRSSGNVRPQALGYLLLQLASSLIIGASAHFAARLGVPSTLAFLAAGIAGVVFSYLVQSLLIFKH